MNLRPIEPIDIGTLTPATPATGEPIFEWVSPRTLFVDPTYQRNIGEKGLRQIRRIIEGFDWTKFTPPVCAYGEDETGATVLKVVDGQHTATAAASNPNVAAIPVMIVEAPDRQSQAKAFIGQNTDRLGVTATQMHVAALAAGDEDAKIMAAVCEAAGVTIRRNPPRGGTGYEPRETMAVAAVSLVIKKDGTAHAERVLRILADAQLAPIKADHIKAAALLLTDPEYGAVDLEALPAHIAAQGLGAMKEAGVLAYGHNIPLWRGLATVWFKKAKKLRKGASGASERQEARSDEARERGEGGAEPTSAPGNTGGARPQARDEAIRAPSDGYFAKPTAPSEPSFPDDPVGDKREALGTWAPGNVVRRCSRPNCDRRFRGAPYAMVCAPCAYGDANG